MPPEKCILNPEIDCLGLQKAKMLEKTMDAHVQASRETHREMFERIRQLEQDNARRDEQYVNIISKIDELSAKITASFSDVESLKMKPAKNWEELTRQILLTAAAALTAFILGRLGI